MRFLGFLVVLGACAGLLLVVRTNSQSAGLQKESTPSTAVKKRSDLRGLAMPTVYCIMAFMPGKEEETVKLALANKVGIFDCDDFTLLVGGKKRRFIGEHKTLGKIYSEPFDDDVLIGTTTWNSSGNTALFNNMWSAVRRIGKYQKYDWTVKLDPDTVFFADRLRTILVRHTDEHPIFGLNCRNYGADGMVGHRGKAVTYMLGAMEVLSQGAMQKYFKFRGRQGRERTLEFFNRTEHTMNFSEIGEDIYLFQFLEQINVSTFVDVHMVADMYCHEEFDCSATKGGNEFGETDSIFKWMGPFKAIFDFFIHPAQDCDCKGDHAAFHPYKNPDSWKECWESASKKKL